MVDITGVEVLHDRVVRLRFSDGSERVVDLAPFLWGPAFEAIADDDEVFGRVRVDPEVGTITWPNGADLDPDVLHGDHEPANPALTSAETAHYRDPDAIAALESGWADVEAGRRRSGNLRSEQQDG